MSGPYFESWDPWTLGKFARELNEKRKKDEELMQMALEVLEYWVTVPNHSVILDLRERLAQPEPAPGYCPHCKQYTIEEPMRREWVGLTDREIEQIARYQDEHGSGPWHRAFASAIEVRLKEKNA